MVETPIEHKLIEGTVNTEPIISELEPKIETASGTTEEVSTPSLPESDKDATEHPKKEATPSISGNTPIEEPNQPSECKILRANAMAEKERALQEKLDKVICAITIDTLHFFLFISQFAIISFGE